MNQQIDRITEKIAPLRQQIIDHKVYGVINDIEDLRIFMQHHVFAVWDFMSLLKALQNNLTCTAVPWFPKGSAETRHLINEIVVGEESDVDESGNRVSHFELYLEAMKQCGANVSQVETFISLLQQGRDFDHAFAAAGVPASVRGFVEFTFSMINSRKDYLQAAIFTFGREDLIPGMFLSMINDMNFGLPGRISTFKYYLERHIEVDGDHHSHLALQMTANLCGSNETFWEEAAQATVASLQQRIKLWDGVYDEIMSVRNKKKP